MKKNSTPGFCQYHPIESASGFCNTCQVYLCENCINQDDYSKNNCCYLCKNEIEELEKTNSILPFWRRLQESFRYPLNTNSAILIIGLAILSTLLGFIPSIFAIIWSLLLTSALFKYSFSCLNNTSHGDLEAPDISEAFGGGFSLALQLLFMLIVLAFVFWGAFYFLGPMFASIVGIILISIMPAVMINFALTENIFEALNPIVIFKLISSVGLPYGLLLGFIMIMMASVGIINELIGNDFSGFTIILQSSVSNYYTVVIFHIMGYMIYQYHKELGFDDLKPQGNKTIRKSVFESNMSQVEILIKEGELNDAIVIFKECISSYPEQRQLKQKYFDLLLATYSSHEMENYASDYLHYLNQENRSDQIPYALKRIFKISPKYKPKSAEQRHMIASMCAEKGDSVMVIKLINGLHKDFPKYHDLVAGYQLMASALDQLPNMKNHAIACRKLIEKLSTEKHNTII
ncbi:MAG: B-box zinc finger protein [Marinicellaceae bacterium]